MDPGVESHDGGLASPSYGGTGQGSSTAQRWGSATLRLPQLEGLPLVEVGVIDSVNLIGGAAGRRRRQEEEVEGGRGAPQMVDLGWH